MTYVNTYLTLYFTHMVYITSIMKLYKVLK